MGDATSRPEEGAATSSRASRTQPRELRRRQLIESTIDSIARRGLAETRMADVAAGAGMSVGIVNFHFDSKQTLLAETLRFLADEYHRAWDAARASADDEPAAQLEALVRMNFNPEICSQRRIAAWYAFFGEARARPTYHELCQQLDDDYLEQLTDLFSKLFDGGSPERTRGAAMMMLSVWDGLWQNILLNPDVFTPDAAVDACLEWLETVFPQSFRRRVDED